MLFWGEVKTKTQQTRKYSLPTLHPSRWQFQHSFPMECQCVIWTKGKRSPKENKTKTLSSMGQDLNHEWAKHHKIFLEEPPPQTPQTTIQFERLHIEIWLSFFCIIGMSSRWLHGKQETIHWFIHSFIAKNEPREWQALGEKNRGENHTRMSLLEEELDCLPPKSRPSITHLLQPSGTNIIFMFPRRKLRHRTVELLSQGSRWWPSVQP